MITGIEATELRRDPSSTICPKIEQVKRSGAVSPAARATASVVPVTMPPSARRQHDAEHGPPLRDAERVARLAEAVRHEREHLHRRPRDEREHDDREREAAGPGALVVADAEHRQLRLDDEREDEDPDHDRREAVEDVEPELDLVGDPRRRELADVDREQRRRPAARSPSRSRRASACRRSPARCRRPSRRRPPGPW